MSLDKTVTPLFGPMERFDEIKIGDHIHIEFETSYSDEIDLRNGIVTEIKYDPDLKSDIVVYGIHYVLAKYRISEDSGQNKITEIWTRNDNPEYFL